MVNHVCVCSASAIVVTCVREPEGVSAIRDPTPLPPSSVHSPSRRGGRAPCPRPAAEATGRHVPRTAGQQPASLHRCQAADSRGAICGDRAPSPHAACATAPRRLARPRAAARHPLTTRATVQVAIRCESGLPEGLSGVPPRQVTPPPRRVIALCPYGVAPGHVTHFSAEHLYAAPLA